MVAPKSDCVVRVPLIGFPGLCELHQKNAQRLLPLARDPCDRRRTLYSRSTLGAVCDSAGRRRVARRFAFRKAMLKGFLKRHKAFQRITACRAFLICHLIFIVVWFSCMHSHASSGPDCNSFQVLRRKNPSCVWAGLNVIPKSKPTLAGCFFNHY